MSKFHYFLKNNSKVTLDNFKLLYNELTLMHNYGYIDRNEEQCKEVIQYIIEYLIYGDKHDSAFFDLFCELNFMNEFIFLSNHNNRQINLQIIKSFSVLILNTTNTTTLYYIFSNNFLNQIVSNDYEKYDDDFLSYYVNFLKSLSLKIDSTTIQFFFQKQFYSFPLLESALKLYNHSDPMIKNTVRNILLTILKIKYTPLCDYFSSLPCITYFAFLACRLRDQIIKLNDEIFSEDQQNLKNIHDDLIDDILFFQDIFSLNLERISYILTNCLLYYVILPFLCGALISMTKPRITISVSLYVFASFIYYIKDENFVNCIFIILFEENITMTVKNYQVEKSRFLKGYFNDWNQQKKSNIKSFTNYISSNFSEPFLKSLVFQANSQYTEIQALVKKYDKLTEETFSSNNNSGLDINDYDIFQTLLEDVLKKFSNSDLDVMTIQHQTLSKATGINLGLTTNNVKKSSPLYVINKMFKVLLNSNDDKYHEEIVENECRLNIFSYLKSKDDTLILLVNLLIYLCMTKEISKELLSRAKLLPANYQIDNHQVENLFEEIFSKMSDQQNNPNYPFNKNNFDLENVENIKQEKYDDYSDNKCLDFFDVNNTEEPNFSNKNSAIMNNMDYINQNYNYSTNNFNHDTKPSDIDFQDLLFYKKFIDTDISKNNQYPILKNNTDNVKNKINLNDDNFDLDFLNYTNHNNKNEKEEFSNLPNSQSIVNNMQKLNIQDEIIKSSNSKNDINNSSNPFDFFPDEYLKLNTLNTLNSTTLNSTENTRDIDHNSLFNKTERNPKNKEEMSYLNFILDNEEKQKLNILNDPFGDVRNEDKPNTILQKQFFEKPDLNEFSKSIKSNLDIKEAYSYGIILNQKEEKNNDFSHTEPSEYRKSLENNKNCPNFKKLEKLFSNKMLLEKFNLKITQDRYDSDTIEILLNLLSVDPQFRTITNRFIYHNFKNLLIREKNISEINEKVNQIDIDHKIQFDSIYFNLIKKIKFFITNNRAIRDNGFEMFEIEWKNFKSDLTIILDNLISQPFLLIPFNLEDIIEDYPQILRIHKNEMEYFKGNLLLFIIHHEIRYMIDPNDNVSISEEFPLKLGGHDIEIDKEYKGEIFTGECHECKLKNNVIRTFQNFVIIMYQNYLCFGIIEQKPKITVKIKFKYALRHIEVQFDKFDPRCLNLIVKEKNNYIDISLIFNDIEKASKMKKNIEENRKSAKNTEYLLFDSYFENLLIKMNYKN